MEKREKARQRVVGAAFGLAIAFVASDAGAVTIFRDNFTTTPYGKYSDTITDSAAGPSWKVNHGTVAVINCSGGFDPCLAMDFYTVPADDTTAKVTSFAQIGFNAGETYGLSVVTALTSGSDSWTISIGDFISKTYSQAGTIAEVLSFTPTKSGYAPITIDLFGTGGATEGPYITAIAVEAPNDYVAPPVSAVPLPASAPLLIAGLIGLAGLKRRRSSKA